MHADVMVELVDHDAVQSAKAIYTKHILSKLCLEALLYKILVGRAEIFPSDHNELKRFRPALETMEDGTPPSGTHRLDPWSNLFLNLEG